MSAGELGPTLMVPLTTNIDITLFITVRVFVQKGLPSGARSVNVHGFLVTKPTSRVEVVLITMPARRAPDWSKSFPFGRKHVIAITIQNHTAEITFSNEAFISKWRT